MDAISWWKLNNLLAYWNERPTIQTLLQGIAMALGANIPTKTTTKLLEQSSPSPLPNKITSGEELIGILQGSGLNFGVVHGS